MATPNRPIPRLIGVHLIDGYLINGHLIDGHRLTAAALPGCSIDS